MSKQTKTAEFATPVMLVFKRQPMTNKIRWTLEGVDNAPFGHTKKEILDLIGYNGPLVPKGSHKEVGVTGSKYQRPRYQIDLALCTKFGKTTPAVKAEKVALPKLRLGPAEEAVYLALKQKGSMTAKEIAEIVGKTMQSVTGTIGCLTKKQIVRKSKEKFAIAK